MIKPSELSKISNKEGVRPQQIEKDYIISWILWGISSDEFLKKALIFKGGTCLKKIYFEDYRYSEDMDFTIHPDTEATILDHEIYLAFNRIFREIKEAANIDISIPESSKDIHETTGSIKFYIDYVGPLGGNGDHVKIDITRGEKLEFEIHQGIVIHQY
jgi:predicted nucleotidyltransferase component of viral defense system